jgi:geranylgeranyl diphosphate synthase type II
MLTQDQFARSDQKTLLDRVHHKIASDFGLSPEHESAVDAAFRHHFKVRGKQTRPRLAIEASFALGLGEQVAVGFAACIEALHNASLVQDDFQDGALKRRGLPSVHGLFGKDVALGLATQLVSAAFVSLASAGLGELSGPISRQVQRAIGETIHGQCDDLNAQPDRSVESLLRIARAKSGPLFALALELPLTASGFEADAMQAREAAGKLGLGYQIIDDLKDRAADSLQPSDANIINALAREMDFIQAKEKALSLAKAELVQASRIAGGLPSGCGARLQQMAEELLNRLQSTRG